MKHIKRKGLLAIVLVGPLIACLLVYLAAWNTSDRRFVRQIFGSRVIVSYENGRAVSISYPDTRNPLSKPLGQIRNHLRFKSTYAMGDTLLSHLHQTYYQLYIRPCHIRTLSPAIERLTHLERLEIQGCANLTLPPEIGKLSNLKVLALRNNNITSLPPEIGHIANLRQLDLRTNQLTTLPFEIYHLANLQVLDFRGNPINTLPFEAKDLPHLQKAGPDLHYYYSNTTFAPQP